MPLSSADALPPLISKRSHILLVDRDSENRTFLTNLFDAEGYAVDVAFDGTAALSSILARPPDVVLLDVELPDHDGFEICRRVRQNVATRLTPIILMTDDAVRAKRIQGFEVGADDVFAKPINTAELLARARSLVRMKQYTDDLDSASSILTTLSTVIEGREGNTTGHCVRMANYATSLGRSLGVGERDIQSLYRGGFLHDVGMLAIPDAVLNKPGRLDRTEFEQVKSHTILGDELCANLRSLQAIRPIIRWHHERLDGSGYPDGLRDDEIPILAQIVGVVDVYEAITTERPYQKRRSGPEAINVLRQEVRCRWRRADIVESFATLMETLPKPS